jgi:hypothetical protein
MIGSKRAAVVQPYLDSLPMPMTEDVGGGVTYVGYTERLGVRPDEKKWLIIRITVVGGLTKPEYASGKSTFESAWNDRATLDYSR